jgi:Lipid A Biosynthesis N-terminal domain
LIWIPGKFSGTWSGGPGSWCSFPAFVQWYATEKKKQVVVPSIFWWLSIIGSLLLLLYAVFYDKHYVVIFSYAFSWIPYIRNLVIHHRHKQAHLDCPSCGFSCPPQSKFCSECGTRLTQPGLK